MNAGVASLWEWDTQLRKCIYPRLWHNTFNLFDSLGWRYQIPRIILPLISLGSHQVARDDPLPLVSLGMTFTARWFVDENQQQACQKTDTDCQVLSWTGSQLTKIMVINMCTTVTPTISCSYYHHLPAGGCFTCVGWEPNPVRSIVCIRFCVTGSTSEMVGWMSMMRAFTSPIHSGQLSIRVFWIGGRRLTGITCLNKPTLAGSWRVLR